MIATAAALALLVPLASAFSSAALPISLKIALAVLWMVAVWRPHGAIVALAAIVPFGSWLLFVLDAPAVRYTEALVLAVLSGALIASTRRRRTPLEGQPPALWPLALIFTAVVLSSLAVLLRVMQTGTYAVWPIVRDFFTYLTRDYLVAPPGAYVGVADAALLVEGLGLMYVAARHARDGVVRPIQIFAAAALSGAAAAGLTIAALVSRASEAASAGAFVRTLLTSRTSVHVIDVNAAGSSFAMAGMVALAFAMNARRIRRPRWPAMLRAGWSAAAFAIFAGIWLTGSRMAIVAGLGAVVVAAATTGPFKVQRWPRWAVWSGALAVALVVAALALGIDPRPSAARTASNMVSMRADFMRTGLRMIGSAPVFGVGIGRYFEMSGRFMPASIYWFYYHENAHNNFLQIGGELGLLGLAAFIVLLAAAALRLVRGLQADADDRLLAGAFAGLGAFVATWLTSHPMLVHEVAYPFWLLLGAALARADGDSAVASRKSQVARRANVAQGFSPANAVVAVILVALVVSIPMRSRREIAALDLSTQTFGFYNWEEENNQKYRWSSRRATFFVPSTARELRLPLRALHIGSNTGPTAVSIAIGGRPFHRVELTADDWTTVNVRLPAVSSGRAFERIDILTDPTWSPAAMSGGRTDVRVLGVEVGSPAIGP